MRCTDNSASLIYGGQQSEHSQSHVSGTPPPADFVCATQSTSPQSNIPTSLLPPDGWLRTNTPLATPDWNSYDVCAWDREALTANQALARSAATSTDVPPVEVCETVLDFTQPYAEKAGFLQGESAYIGSNHTGTKNGIEIYENSNPSRGGPSNLETVTDEGTGVASNRLTTNSNGVQPSAEFTQQHAEPLQLSPQAKLYLGKQIPKNTTRNNSNALRALCTFIFENFITNRNGNESPNEIEAAARAFMFSDGTGSFVKGRTSSFSVATQIQVRDVLIEFVTRYRNTRTGADIKPSTLKNYITSIQRAFNHMWGYELHLLSGPIFDCPDAGLVSVLDNKAREQQRLGGFTESHNVLSREEVVALFKSPSLCKQTPVGFQTRLVFSIGLLTGMRPTALWSLSVGQFSLRQHLGKECLVITGAVGATNGSSKTCRGGWASIGQKPLEICVWNETYHGCINFFEDIDSYLRLRSEIDPGTDRFFLGVNHRAANIRDFFKRSPIGKNTFGKIVKDACVKEGINGSGSRGWVTTHGLRGSLASILFGAGHSDSSVVMRTGHRDPRSLKSYQNLRGIEGIKQQRDIFNEPNTSMGTENKRSSFHETGGTGAAGSTDGNLEARGKCGVRVAETGLHTVNGHSRLPGSSTNAAEIDRREVFDDEGSIRIKRRRLGGDGPGDGGDTSVGAIEHASADGMRHALSTIGTVTGGTINVTMNYYNPRDN